jgi:hypothetical protein
MPESFYNPSTTIRLAASFKASGVLTDPATVSLTVKDPASVSTTYTWAGAQVIKDATGRFHYDLTPVLPGRWYFKWVGTGAVAATTEESFRVRELEIP